MYEGQSESPNTPPERASIPEIYYFAKPLQLL